MTKLSRIGSFIIHAILMVLLLVTGILAGFEILPMWLGLVAALYGLAVLILDSFIQINFIKKGKVILFGKEEK